LTWPDEILGTHRSAEFRRPRPPTPSWRPMPPRMPADSLLG